MPKEKKFLIAYFSHGGNTKTIAKTIQLQTGGDLFEIKPVNPYPKYYSMVAERAQKEKSADFKPPLLEKIGNLKDYDVVFVGTPVWWYTMAAPLKTFLTEYDFTGKVVAPFCTHGGGGEALTFTDVEKLLPGIKVTEGLSIYEDGEKGTLTEITNWIKKNHIE